MVSRQVVQRPAQRQQKQAGIPEMHRVGIAEYFEDNPQGDVEDQQDGEKVQEEHAALLIIHTVDFTEQKSQAGEVDEPGGYFSTHGI